MDDLDYSLTFGDLHQILITLKSLPRDERLIRLIDKLEKYMFSHKVN